MQATALQALTSAPTNRCAGNNETVTLRRLLAPKRRLDLGRHEATARDAQRGLEQALKKQKKRLAVSAGDAVDVQLLGQVTSAAEWSKLLAYWERRKPGWVATWPQQLEPGACALNLWPLPAGRVGRAAGLGADVRKRQPKRVLATPGVNVFDPEAVDVRTGFAVVCAIWLENAGTDFKALQLAPPVLEASTTGGRLVSREIVDFGLEWSLPPADGLEPGGVGREERPGA